MIVDSHVHVVAADAGRYPLRPSGVGSQWFREHPVTVEEYALLATDAGVERAVLVQAHGAYGSDNAYVFDGAAAAPERFVSVGIVDPDDPAAPATLRGFSSVPRCAGVRLFGIGPTSPGWFDSDVGHRLWETAAELDLRIVATLLAPELPRLRRMLTRFPAIPVVLDHCGFPDLHGGSPYPGLEPLLELAQFESLHLKVTSHVLEAAGSEDDACALVDRLASAYGAPRLVWGSDYPQTHDRSYADLVALGSVSCGHLSATDRDLVMGGNALRLWPALA